MPYGAPALLSVSINASTAGLTRAATQAVNTVTRPLVAASNALLSAANAIGATVNAVTATANNAIGLANRTIATATGALNDAANALNAVTDLRSVTVAMGSANIALGFARVSVGPVNVAISSATSALGAAADPGQVADAIGTATTAMGAVPASIDAASDALGLVGDAVAAGDTAAQAMLGDAVTVTASRAAVPWGIFREGEPVVRPDSVVALDYRSEWQIADFPQEEGAFQSYNKVAKPFDIRMRMTKGGNADDRQQFLTALEALLTSLELCDVTTPEKTYIDVSVSAVDYARTATNGVGLLTADITLRQVRVTAKAAFAKTADPSGAEAVNGGTVQPQPPTAAEAAPSADAPTAPAPTVNPAAAPAAAAAAPASAPAQTFPAGYTQSSDTGLIYDADGKVDRDMSAKVGPGEVTGLPSHSENVQHGSTTTHAGGG